jgi:hypothetical protein
MTWSKGTLEGDGALARKLVESLSVAEWPLLALSGPWSNANV